MIVNTRDLNSVRLGGLKTHSAGGNKWQRVQSCSRSSSVYLDALRILIRLESPLPVITEAIRDVMSLNVYSPNQTKANILIVCVCVCVCFKWKMSQQIEAGKVQSFPKRETKRPIEHPWYIFTNHKTSREKARDGEHGAQAWLPWLRHR